MKDLDFILRVLGTMADADCERELSWRTDGEFAPITFWINCNDFFWWGCADGQDLGDWESLDVLDKAIADCRALDEEHWGPLLFCARDRGMRPQGAYYKLIPEKLWPLFHACGPEREVGLGNPSHPKKAEPKPSPVPPKRFWQFWK